MRLKERTQHKQVFYENVSETILRRRGGNGIVYSVSSTNEKSVSWSGSVSDATPTEIFLDGVTDSRLEVVEGATIFHYYCLAVDESTYEVKAWEIVGVARRLTDTVVKTRIDPIGGETVLAAANITVTYSNHYIRPYVQGIAGKNITFIISNNPIWS